MASIRGRTCAGAANAGSAAPVIGNPQNILIGQVGRLDFWEFSLVFGQVGRLDFWEFSLVCGPPALFGLLSASSLYM